MSAKIVMWPHTTSSDVWKGHAAVNRSGVELAIEMLDELEDIASDEAGVTVADYSSLEDWARQGRPFRNVVADYLQRARAAGPDVEAGYCAVLSDLVALVALGSVPHANRYAALYGIE